MNLIFGHLKKKTQKSLKMLKNLILGPFQPIENIFTNKKPPYFQYQINQWKKKTLGHLILNLFVIFNPTIVNSPFYSQGTDTEEIFRCDQRNYRPTNQRGRFLFDRGRW